MSIGSLALASEIMAILFLLLGIFFAVRKGKAAILISGYNFKTKEQRNCYDEDYMARDMRNQLFLYAGIFLAGGIATLFAGSAAFLVTVIIWLAVFFKNVHLNPDKAFEKYRKDNKIE